MPKESNHKRPALNPIALRGLLGDLDPSTCKLHCAVSNGLVEPIDVLATDWNEWVGWSRYRGQTDHFNRDFIFTMAREHKTADQWLFGGVFEVTARKPIPKARSYTIKLRDDIMGEYIKRLVISFRAPGRLTRLNLETHLDQMTVAAIRETPYVGEPFPGIDRLNHTFLELRSVLRQNRSDWRSRLESVKGVYVIHDEGTGRPYVGAAYGLEGIWQRLGSYVNTLHGGNTDLKKLVKQKGEQYVLQNFRFALLEPLLLSAEDKRVTERETYWKEVLMSRTFGNNRN